MFEKIVKKIMQDLKDKKEIDESEFREKYASNLSDDDYNLLLENLEKDYGFTISSNEKDDEDIEPENMEDINISDFDLENFEATLLHDSEHFQTFDETTDPVRMYLKEIGKIPLLKLDEERKLGLQISDFKIARQIEEDNKKNGIILDPKEERKLQRRIEKGEKAAKKLTEANYRLVVSIAKKYEKNTISMAFLDLIQEGNMGLMRAVEKFDHSKGFKFSTYATWWIKQGITRSIAEKSRTIRIPVHMNETINKMNKARRILIQELGREPSEQEIVDRVNLLDTKQKLTVEKMRMIKNISPNPLSLETPVGEEEESSFGNLISDKNTANPHQNMVDETVMAVLSDALRENLTDREEKVLRMRTGLYDGHEYTLEEVGLEFSVTRERIRQIENKAKMKLRKPELKKLFLSVLKKKKDF